MELPADPAVAWLARVEVPIHGAWSGWSKNRTWRAAGGGRMRLSGAAATRRALMASAIARALRGHPVARATLWVALHVDLPSHQGDAHNALPLVLDAVQRATGLDDRWAAVYRCSWAVKPAAPRLLVWIGQDPAAVDSAVCGSCGVVQPLEAFTRDRRSSSGASSSCRSCAAAGRRRRATRREALAAADAPPVEPGKLPRAPWS